MPKIEVEPLLRPEIELAGIVATKMEDILADRNNFTAEDLTDNYSDGIYSKVESQDRIEKIYAVSSTLVLPSDFLPNEDARLDLRNEHQEHLKAVQEQGIDLGSLARLAITGNLQTELNLPQFQSEMMERLLKVDNGENDPQAIRFLQDWVRTWTAEEKFHEDVLREAGLAMEVINARELDIASINMATNPLGIDMDSLVELWCFLTIQEKSTVLSHKNTALLFGNRVKKMMYKVSSNESTHEKVNTDLVRIALEVDPNHTVQAYYKQVRNFFMPGKEGIPFFKAYLNEMAVSGIFDYYALRNLERQKTEQLKIKDLSLSGRGAESRDKLMDFLDNPRFSTLADSRIEEQREERITEAKKRGMVPFILGRTVSASFNVGIERIA